MKIHPPWRLNWKWLNKEAPLELHLRNSRQNNFKGIRLLAALLVVFSHCYGYADPLIRITGGALNTGNLGLSVFFFLSGLLVSQSLHNSPSRKNFVWKRFLRLYPAACIAVLACALLLGPLVTGYRLSAYFSDASFFRYLAGCSLIKIWYQLPGVFLHSPLGTSSVNSSLWTLSLELKLYIGLLLLSLLKSRTGIWVTWGLLIAAVILVYSPWGGAASLIPALAPYARFGSYFLLGMLCFHYRSRLVIRGYWIALLPLLLLLHDRFPLHSLAALVLVPALVLFCAIYIPRPGRRITPDRPDSIPDRPDSIPQGARIIREPDLSYGIYVFAFPVQQLVVNYVFHGGPGPTFLLTTLFTLPLALASWYGLESRAMKWKYRVK